MSLNSLLFFNQSVSSLDSTNFGNQKSIQLFPAFGYSKELNRLWLGCELAYKQVKYNVYSSSTASVLPFVRTETNSLPTTSIYFAPYLLRSFASENLRFNIGIELPLEYFLKREQILNSWETDKVSQNTYLEKKTQRLYPKILNWAAYMQLGIYRKLYRGLYFGAEMGVGITNEIYFGNRIDTYQEMENGITTINRETIIKYERNISGSLNFRPTLSLQYYW